MAGKLAAATRAYERDRYSEALNTLRGLSRTAPDSPAVRELLGLTLYRMGRWRDAERELRRFAELSGSFEQHPVIADCERALFHYDAVDRIYAELRRAPVSSEVLGEARLVMAGSLADQGRIEEAIGLLAPGSARSVAKPSLRHLRAWYVLADLFERAGDLPRARELFSRVAVVDPELTDAPERLSALA
jgi:tetratricopeptide (TPR) repeat protein